MAGSNHWVDQAHLVVFEEGALCSYLMASSLVYDTMKIFQIDPMVCTEIPARFQAHISGWGGPNVGLLIKGATKALRIFASSGTLLEKQL